MLVMLGYAPSVITVVGNGQLALEAVEKRGGAQQQSATPAFPLVLMDVFMPIMGGLEATRALRASTAISPSRQPYICALTANAMSGDREVCLQAGKDCYVSKVTSHSQPHHARSDRITRLSQLLLYPCDSCTHHTRTSVRPSPSSRVAGVLLLKPVTLEALRDALHRGWSYWQRKIVEQEMEAKQR